MGVGGGGGVSLWRGDLVVFFSFCFFKVFRGGGGGGGGGRGGRDIPGFVVV